MSPEDVAHTVNVLCDHFCDYMKEACSCGKKLDTLHDWGLHVAEVLHS